MAKQARLLKIEDYRAERRTKVVDRYLASIERAKVNADCDIETHGEYMGQFTLARDYARVATHRKAIERCENTLKLAETRKEIYKGKGAKGSLAKRSAILYRAIVTNIPSMSDHQAVDMADELARKKGSQKDLLKTAKDRFFKVVESAKKTG